MRPLRLIWIAGFVAMASVQACFGSYGTISQTFDSGASDPSTVVDGGLVDADATPPFDADASPSCFDFTSGSSHEFLLSGGAALTSGGLVLDLQKNGQALATRSFTAAKPISVAALTLEGTSSLAGSWGDAGLEFVTLLAQYYGSKQASTALSTATTFALTRGLSNPDIELNTWHAPNQYAGNDRIGPFVSGDAEIIIRTEYGNSGKVSFTALGGTATVNANTRSGPPSDIYTLVLGGGATANAISVTLTVRSLCVAFE